MNKTRKKLITICLLFFNLCLWATNYNIDTLAIQQSMKKVPSSSKKAPDLLGTYISTQYNDEPSKAYAISYWIATNIEYDFKGRVERRAIEYKPEMVLKEKKALCGEYAKLFKAVCDSANLQAIVIDGYTRDFDFLPGDTLFRAEHSWSAVKINDQWQLVDLTYAAGNLVPLDESTEISDSILYTMPYHAKSKFESKFNSKWIFADPAMVILTHYPILRDLQLLEQPISFENFRIGEEAIREQLEINSNIITNSDELIQFSKLSDIDRYYFIGDKGVKLNKFDNRIKAYSYLSALNLVFDRLFDGEKNLLSGSKSDLKKNKKRAYTTDSIMKFCLPDNELEFRQIQKRSENWKMSLKTNNKLHREDLKNRIRTNNTNLKVIEKMYQKGISLSQHLNEKKAQFVDQNIDDVKRPKLKDLRLEREGESLMRQQDSIRKLNLGVLFQIENIIREYNQDKVIERCKKEKKSVFLYEASIQTMQEIAKSNSNNLFMVHIPTTNVNKMWMKERNMEADNINKENIDTLLVNLSKNQLKLNDLIRVYTSFLKEQLNLLKLAKKSSTVDHKEDSLYRSAVENFADNLLSYHFELKTYTITSEILKDNLELENKKMTDLIEKLQKESDVENDRHKTYMEYRKLIKNAENLKTKLAIKRLIQINILLDKSIILAK